MDIESSILFLLNLIIISVRAIRWLTKVRAQSKPALCSFCDYIKRVNGHSRDNICDLDLLSNRHISPYNIAHHVFMAGPECFMFPGHMRLYLGLGSFLSE